MQETHVGELTDRNRREGRYRRFAAHSVINSLPHTGKVPDLVNYTMNNPAKEEMLVFGIISQ